MSNHSVSRRQLFLSGVRSFLPDRLSTDSNGICAHQPISFLPHLDEAGYTPTRHFFRHQTNQVVEMDALYWSIRLDGLVKTPATLTLEDLQLLPVLEKPCTILCSWNTSRNTLIGHALWRGVPFGELVRDLGVLPEARYVYVTSADGYTTCLEIEALANALLAYRMNDDVLPPEHGYPARLIAPGLYGYKMPKWIRHFEFTHTFIPGYWESRGETIKGIVEPTAVIFSPRHLEIVEGLVAIGGVAYTGKGAITAVEVSIDYAPWMPVPFHPTPRHSWTPWVVDWTPPAPGDYFIQVRAGNSETLKEASSSAMSSSLNSTEAYHSVTVRVV